jgi:glyoxylase-like metal-dependent hydrolase (beta-lactamase superfamily II)
MHRDDGAAKLGIEQVIEGEDPVDLGDDLLAIPTPGHTRGHVVFLYKQKFLFTGDHLAWSPSRQTLTAFRSVAWYSWPEQIRSMESCWLMILSGCCRVTEICITTVRQK